MNMNAMDKLSNVLVVLGGLNWGLVGFFEYNLVDELFDAGSTVARVIYAVVGVAALYLLYTMLMMMGNNKKGDS
ncbi:MAG: DUF378 domain-containing protein [Candidatus Saccharimonadales bacterium]